MEANLANSFHLSRFQVKKICRILPHVVVQYKSEVLKFEEHNTHVQNLVNVQIAGPTPKGSNSLGLGRSSVCTPESSDGPHCKKCRLRHRKRLALSRL